MLLITKVSADLHSKNLMKLNSHFYNEKLFQR